MCGSKFSYLVNCRWIVKTERIRRQFHFCKLCREKLQNHIVGQQCIGGIRFSRVVNSVPSTYVILPSSETVSVKPDIQSRLDELIWIDFGFGYGSCGVLASDFITYRSKQSSRFKSMSILNLFCLGLCPKTKKFFF